MTKMAKDYLTTIAACPSIAQIRNRDSHSFGMKPFCTFGARFHNTTGFVPLSAFAVDVICKCAFYLAVMSRFLQILYFLDVQKKWSHLACLVATAIAYVSHASSPSCSSIFLQVIVTLSCSVCINYRI